MKYFVAVFTTAVLVFVGATIYYKGLPNFPTFNKNLVSTQSGVPVVSNEVAPEVDETSIVKAAMRDALIAKHGTQSATLNIIVSKIEGNYAQGGASAQGGGAMWFAAKTSGVWKLVWDGNGQINCSDIAPYPDLPISMIPECWNESTSKIVVR
jgi:hypothetical protein